jgi:thymidine kinase
MLANLSSPAKARLRKAGEYVHETHKITTMFFSSYVDEIKQQDITGRPKPYGAVELILGPMFAGKSTELIRRVRDAKDAGCQVAVVKSSLDTRYIQQHVTTHYGDYLPCITSDTLVPLLDSHFKNVDVIAVDEGQFFPDLVDFVLEASESRRKSVIIAGLDGDFKRQRFGQMLDVVPMADTVTKMSGKCHFCGEKSLFSLRVAADGRQALIGGAEAYLPVCRHHYVDLSLTRGGSL